MIFSCRIKKERQQACHLDKKAVLMYTTNSSFAEYDTLRRNTLHLFDNLECYTGSQSLFSGVLGRILGLIILTITLKGLFKDILSSAELTQNAVLLLFVLRDKKNAKSSFSFRIERNGSSFFAADSKTSEKTREKHWFVF